MGKLVCDPARRRRRVRSAGATLAVLVATLGGCASHGHGVVPSTHAKTASAGDGAYDASADGTKSDATRQREADAAVDASPDRIGQTDSDGDGVPDREDDCPMGLSGWTSNAESDIDGDGCRDFLEDSEVWVPVDLHTHADHCDDMSHSPSEMFGLMEGAGIRAASVLLWGSWTKDLPLLTGADDPISSPTRILHFDIEISGFTASTGGHLLLLGLPAEALPEVWPDPYVYPGGSGVPIVTTGFGRLAALRGMAHGWTWPADGTFPAPPLGCCMALELPVHVALGTIDFFSTEDDFESDPNSGSVAVWERLLQSGFKLPFAPASDWSCLRGRVGEMRSQVMLSGPLSYASVLAAVKAGRVVGFADDTPRRLDMHIDGARLGDTLDVPAGKSVDVEIRTDQPQAGVLQLIENGQVVHEETLPPGRQTRRVSLALTRSAWIRARIPRATTSPIYVTTGGAPIRPSTEAPCYFIRYIDHLSGLVDSGAVNLNVDTTAALRAYTEARSVFETRFTEAGGLECP